MQLFYQSKQINNDYISVSLAQPLSAGLGRSIQIDFKDAIKSKINLIKTIQKEPTSELTYVYPVEVSSTTVNILPIQAINNDYISVSLAQPISAGLGRSIQIDLKDNTKSVISNAHQYARRNEANVLWQTNTFMANTTVQADLTVTGNIINTNLTNLTNQSFKNTIFYLYRYGWRN
jgi:hypothetical protein